MKNYYQILQVDKSASPSVITKVYRYLIKESHPDLYTDEDDKEIAEIRIKELNEAYETLSDSELRKKYDVELNNQEQELLLYVKELERKLNIYEKQSSNPSHITSTYDDYDSNFEDTTYDDIDEMNKTNYAYSYIKYTFQKIIGIALLIFAFFLLILTIF